jgi:hypothetical protein
MDVWVVSVYKFGGMLYQGVYSSEELAINASKSLPFGYHIGINKITVDSSIFK